MVNNTGLESLCIVEDNPNATKRLIEELMSQSFDSDVISQRKHLLDSHFSNQCNAEKIIHSVWRE